jgi:hypothetical protein
MESENLKKYGPKMITVRVDELIELKEVAFLGAEYIYDAAQDHKTKCGTGTSRNKRMYDLIDGDYKRSLAAGNIVEKCLQEN